MKKPTVGLLLPHRGTHPEAIRTEAYELNYRLSRMFLSKYKKQTTKLLRLPTNGRNHHVGVTSTLKTCISTVLKQETTEAKHKNRGKERYQSITCYDGWRSGL